MKELELKYGCNPNQKPSRIYIEDGSERLAARKRTEGGHRTSGRHIL